jgi:predicted nucleotidyltransferase
MAVDSDLYSDYREAWLRRDRERRRQWEERRQEAVAAVRRCAEVLARRFGVRRVYLFGSVLDGERFHGGSDIDLAVEGLGPGRVYWRALAALWALLPRDLSLDLVPLEDASEQWASQIRREGEVIYSA